MKKKSLFFKCIAILFIVFTICVSTKNVKATQEENRETVLKIESLNIEKFEKNKEVSLPITVTNAQALCGGSLNIDYSSDLVFKEVENKNEQFTYMVVNNAEENKLVITFSGKEGYNGDITLLNIKFNLPGTSKNDKYYLVNFADETTLLTANTVNNNYTINSGEIYVKKGNEKNSITNIILIVVGVIVVLGLIIIIGKSRAKRNRKK